MNSIDATIISVKVTNDGRTFAKLIDEFGNPIGKEQFGSWIDDNSINNVEADYRLMKAGPAAISSIKSKKDYAALIGSEKHRIMSTDKFGNIITGPTTLTANLEQIRLGGAYRINGLHSSTMASTIITPMPFLIFDFPAMNMLTFLSKTAIEFSTMIGL